MIDPAKVCLFIPPGLKKFKLDLFERIGRKIKDLGGQIVRDNHALLDALPRNIIPIIGCSPVLKPMIQQWRIEKRDWIYWDRGYARRVFATWLPRAASVEASYYRWHLNSFQLQQINDLPNDRWDALKIEVKPWAKNPDGHVVIACPTPTYEKFHGIEGWTERTLRRLARITDRQIVTRDKESKRPLQDDINGAICLVSHGSIAAVEAVICGCPVVVDADSAASLVGDVALYAVEKPIYPDRTAWLNSLAYSQFNETELVDGTLWRMIK